MTLCSDDKLHRVSRVNKFQSESNENDGYWLPVFIESYSDESPTVMKNVLIAINA